MIQKTKFKDLFLIKSNTYKDQRGYFKELIKENQLKKKFPSISVFKVKKNVHYPFLQSQAK